MDRDRFAAIGCSVARTAWLIADPWTLLVLRDLFLGLTRYEELHRDLGVATNVLADRLERLVSGGLVTRHACICTLVRSLTAEARYVQEAESVSALFPNMEATEQRTLSERVVRADTALSKLLDCRRGDQWKLMESLRSIRKHQLPVAYSHLYLPMHLASLSKHFDRLSAPAYTVIDRKSKSHVAKMHQETSACAVPDIAAQRLGGFGSSQARSHDHEGPR